jgi:hypothetical protein
MKLLKGRILFVYERGSRAVRGIGLVGLFLVLLAAVYPYASLLRSSFHNVPVFQRSLLILDDTRSKLYSVWPLWIIAFTWFIVAGHGDLRTAAIVFVEVIVAVASRCTSKVFDSSRQAYARAPTADLQGVCDAKSSGAICLEPRPDPRPIQPGDRRRGTNLTAISVPQGLLREFVKHDPELNRSLQVYYSRLAFQFSVLEHMDKLASGIIGPATK